MRVNCEGCAGCCIDWRPVASNPSDHERSGRRAPLDDTYNLVPLTRDEVRDYVDAGLADALTPRLFAPASVDDRTTVDGRELAAIDDRPVFVVGLRKPPKPVGPFGLDPVRLRTCVFLDPETLQCRIHGDEHYPETCRSYPGQNLTLDRETECERVEADFGGERLLDREPPADAAPMFGPAALGSKVFVHPEPDRLAGVVSRLAAGELTDADRAEFVGVAVGSRPGTAAVDGERAQRAREAALAADSWVGRVAADWFGEGGADALGEPSNVDIAAAARREERYGAPPTPGWDAVESDAGSVDGRD